MMTPKSTKTSLGLRELDMSMRPFEPLEEAEVVVEAGEAVPMTEEGVWLIRIWKLDLMQSYEGLHDFVFFASVYCMYCSVELLT